MIEIDITVEAGEWKSAAHLSQLSTQALRAAVLHASAPLPENAEVSVVFTDDGHVQALNRQWRDQDKPTNVLSFAANDGEGPQSPLLGDIIVAFETVRGEAIEQKKRFDDHLAHLLVHGFLHLLGYDHIEDAEAEEMEALETLILASLGIAPPYDDRPVTTR